MQSKRTDIRMPRGTDILCVTSERVDDSMGIFIYAMVPALTTEKEVESVETRRFELLIGNGDYLEDADREFIGTTKHMGGAYRVFLFEKT